ncbi:MAG: MBL fold metallo-hydrolase [Eubacteriales bacterium]
MAKIKVGHFVIGSVQTNCYFVYDEDTKDAIVVDPADQGEEIYKTLLKNGFQVAAIFLTHGHFDHILGCQTLRKAAGVKVYASAAEKEICEDTAKNLSASVGYGCTIKANHYLQDGEEITVAGMTCKMILTPGHTSGSCCYYFEEAGVLISGDTLFEGSVGRTDFPTGSMGTLVRSIKEKLMVLPENVVVYPGHGNTTTIGEEKNSNPFI